MEGVIYRYTYTLLAFAHAEGAAQLDLIADIVIGDKVLKLLYDLTRSLDMAGTSDTNRDFKHDTIPLNVLKI